MLNYKSSFLLLKVYSSIKQNIISFLIYIFLGLSIKLYLVNNHEPGCDIKRLNYIVNPGFLFLYLKFFNNLFLVRFRQAVYAKLEVL